ncbi:MULTISPECIES: RluA family pseudouridine synthase [Fusobacterium]|jgi:23S rRNA pseudouridine1911/1915/1917 synthase|uniref:RluA family pseudouridine synthase n=1 Tax=Fusobacterium TaxID=848 RepID=UPI0008A5C29D|nr:MULTISPECIES: RluA family pseudouridine synthase [Fusobacterium]MCF0169086.1 RluA family pseudouridine synthase [Fusobacterium varium]MCF2672238.1 RluA family pseudouridine synthase [Fusobacterium varium]MCI6033320.1 RluA family pseudouridine synthase [Fusobacterium varium]MDY4007112.1 RluA family pseudouridine synthase [Fusobacterium varium]OFL93396.1 RNA pseudouridine synthase [Fusobacterium sp. HMSC073F01]
MKKFIIEPEYDGYEIGTYLKETKGYSGRGLRNLEIYLNGKRVKNNSKKVRKLNRLLIKEKDKETGIIPMEIPIKVAYEDKNILLIDKEPYIIVHPTQKKVDKTLANGVVNYFLKTTGKIMVPRFYNRLDMNTSGLIIVAKNSYAQSFLQEKGIVNKFYKAIVKGIIEKDEFLIDKPIGKVGDDLRRREISVENGGQEAQTKIKVIKRLKDLTLIEAELLTGRTHQIRAHMALEGYPLLGDELYGGEDKRAKRQMLHSYKTQFSDIETGELKTVEIDIPDDMKSILSEE